MIRSIKFALVIVFLLAFSTHAQNIVQIENAKTGTAAWNLTNPAALREIEGYANKTSVNRGGAITFHVSVSVAQNIKIEVFRTGWYAGLSARQMTIPGASSIAATLQTTPTPDSDGMVDCSWPVTYTLNVPDDADHSEWASGQYLAKLTGLTSTKESYIHFVVRDDSRSNAKYLFQASVTTYQAYNDWGGRSMYTTPQELQARKVSFNRPYALKAAWANAKYGVGSGEFLGGPNAISFGQGWEINMVRFMEREGYDVTYCTNIDLHENTSIVLGHQMFNSVGHDEYWSWEMFDAIENAADESGSPTNMGFWGANTGYWQVRLSIDSRIMTSYKQFAAAEDPFALDGDPTNNTRITGLWQTASQGNRPEAALIGVAYYCSPVTGDFTVTNSSHWIFAGTGFTNGTLLVGIVGVETDKIAVSSPGGITTLATAPGCSSTATMTYYVRASGAKVFASATNQMPWGLDDWEFPDPGPDGHRPLIATEGMKQMARNILNDFGGTGGTGAIRCRFHDALRCS